MQSGGLPKHRDAKAAANAAFSQLRMDDLGDDLKDPDFAPSAGLLRGEESSSDDEEADEAEMLIGRSVRDHVMRHYDSWMHLWRQLPGAASKSRNYREFEREARLLDAMDEAKIDPDSKPYETAVRNLLAVQAIEKGRPAHYVDAIFSSMSGERTPDLLAAIPKFGKYLRKQTILEAQLEKQNRKLPGNKSGGDGGGDSSQYYGGSKKKRNRGKGKKKKDGGSNSSSSSSSGGNQPKSESKRGGDTKGKSSTARDE